MVTKFSHFFPLFFLYGPYLLVCGTRGKLFSCVLFLFSVCLLLSLLRHSLCIKMHPFYLYILTSVGKCLHPCKLHHQGNQQSTTPDIFLFSVYINPFLPPAHSHHCQPPGSKLFFKNFGLK